jgi:outer membrane lipoprotein-sorting protein
MNIDAAAEVSPKIQQVITKARAAYAQINDYTCILHKQERVNGKLKEKSEVIFKYKKPSRYYMKWPQDSIEAIYAEGRYDNRMVIHGGWLLKFLSVAVDPAIALESNRHTLLEADIGQILKVVESNYRLARTHKNAQITFKGIAHLEGREVMVFNGLFPPDEGFYGHRIRVDIDRENHLPIRITVHGWEDELLERYHYTDLALNVGLTEEDFDINNSSYLFKFGSNPDFSKGKPNK